MQQNVNAEAQWIAEEEMPTSQIYTHQILSVSGDSSAKYIRCDPLQTTDIAFGQVGVTRYGLLDAQVFKSINSVAGFNWGIFEWNIGSETTNTYPNYMMMLRAMYQYGLRVVCPYAWFSGYPYQILQIANNTAFIQVIRDFAQQVGNVPRGTFLKDLLVQQISWKMNILTLKARLAPIYHWLLFLVLLVYVRYYRYY